MDELVDAYIKNNISSELASDVRYSFALLEIFGDKFAEGYFLNLIGLEGVEDKNDIYDEFFTLLYKRLNEVLSQHFLKLDDIPSLGYINEIVSALALFQGLDDYEYISIALDDEKDDVDKVAFIFSKLCYLSDIEILEHLEIESSKFVDGLKQFIKNKLNNVENPVDATYKTTITLNMKKLNSFLGDNECVGINIIKQGYEVGYEFAYYASLLDRDEFIKEDDMVSTALNILSLLLISRDTYQHPMVAFDDLVEQLLPAKEQIAACRLLISQIFLDFLNYLRE